MSYLKNKMSNLLPGFFRAKLLFIVLIAMALPVTAEKQDNQSASTVLRYDISGSSAWYPYFIPDSKKPGIVAELVSVLLAEAQITGQQVALPPKRTLFALTNGELDFDVISPSWFPNSKVPEGFVLSDGLIEIREYVVTLPQNAQRFQQSSALNNQNIGTIRGYFYNNDKLFTRVDFLSESKLIKALLMGRIEAAIIGDLPALYWAQQNNAKIAFGPINSKGDLHIRLQAKHARLLPQINQAIEIMKQQGTVSQIVAQYLSVLPDTALVTSKSQSINAD